MNKKKIIIEQMKAVGTYHESKYNTVIDLLTNVLTRYEMVLKNWKEEGKPLFSDRISDRGSVNKIKNINLQMLEDYEKEISALCEKLGLTPTSLKKIDSTDKDKNNEVASPFFKMLKQIETEKEPDNFS